jgi:hypothetical protein
VRRSIASPFAAGIWLATLCVGLAFVAIVKSPAQQMPYRFAKAQLVHGPELLGFVYGTEIRHLMPFFLDLLVDRQRTLQPLFLLFLCVYGAHMLTFVIRQPSIR